MTGGEKVLIAGVVGVGVIAYLKYRSAQSNLPPSTKVPLGAPPFLPNFSSPGSFVNSTLGYFIKNNTTQEDKQIITPPLAVIGIAPKTATQAQIDSYNAANQALHPGAPTLQKGFHKNQPAPTPLTPEQQQAISALRIHL